jgi:anti-sigma factor RsiW
VIERLRTVWVQQRHPRSALLSRYLEGDLDARRRRALETHVGRCPRCKQELASLSSIVSGLGALEPHNSPRLAQSIIAALRAEPSHPGAASDSSEGGATAPPLAVVPATAHAPAGDRLRRSQEARAAVRWCLQKPRLRLTLPIALIAGLVLSFVNMGGMLMHGRIDAGVCVSCAIDFVVPFLALNLGLLMLLWVPRRRQPPLA